MRRRAATITCLIAALAVGGCRIGCAVTRGVSEALKPFREVFALDKDARIRVWDADGPLFNERPLVYPARQAWFASMTQMANEKTHVDAGEAHQTGQTHLSPLRDGFRWV